MKEFKPIQYPEGQFVIIHKYNDRLWATVYYNDDGVMKIYDNVDDRFFTMDPVQKEFMERAMTECGGKIFTA